MEMKVEHLEFLITNKDSCGFHVFVCAFLSL